MGRKVVDLLPFNFLSSNKKLNVFTIKNHNERGKNNNKQLTNQQIIY